MIGAEERAKMLEMRALNYEIREIAEELDVSRNTVTRHLNKLKDEADSTGDPEKVVVKTVMEGMVQRKSAEELMSGMAQTALDNRKG
jgi:predicted ArsR family transcriptional regulator